MQESITITFTYMGSVITTVETSTVAPPVVFSEPSSTSTSSSSRSSSTHRTVTPFTTQSTQDASPSSNGGNTATGGNSGPTTFITATPSPTYYTPTPILSVVKSCIQSTTTVSDQSDAQNLAKKCSTFSGDIVIPTSVSSPIDLSGMQALEGSLVCEGSENGGFDTLSSNSLTSIRDNLTIQNTHGFTNLSFPEMISLGALTISGNSDLHEFDSMKQLSTVDGPVQINGSFTSVSLPLIDTVQDSFIIDSTDNLNCRTVAPIYSFNHTGNAAFFCQSTNMSLTIDPSGTHETDNVPGPKGMSKKDIALASVFPILGFLALLAICIYAWLYRRTMKTTATLARSSFGLKARNRAEKRASIAASRAQSRRASQTPTSLFGFPRSPPTPPSFSINRPVNPNPTAQRNVEELRRQLGELRQKANTEGLTAHDKARLEWISNCLMDIEGEVKV